MWSTIVAISLGVTSLAALALFYYFRQRIAKVEHKVDIMFQLIQEHNTARQFPPTMVRGPVQQSRAADSPGELIEISGDDADSDDSSVVSDTEEDGDPITISSAAGDGVRAIELKLSGAEASGAQEANSEDLDDLDEVSDIDDQADEEEGIVFLEGDTGDGIDMNELVEVDATLADGEEDEEEEDGVEAPEEVVLEPVADEEVKTVALAPVASTPDLGTMTVKELKKLAAERQLSNYKSLRRPKLIELLESAAGQ